MDDTVDPHYVSGNNNGKLTYSGKGKVVDGADDVQIKVTDDGTSLEFKTDFQGQTHYKSETPNEEYKSNAYQFIRGRGNPEVNFRTQDESSYITFSLTKIKK